MTEAVSLGELLHEEALFGLTGVGKVGVPRGRLLTLSAHALEGYSSHFVCHSVCLSLQHSPHLPLVDNIGQCGGRT